MASSPSKEIEEQWFAFNSNIIIQLTMINSEQELPGRIHGTHSRMLVETITQILKWARGIRLPFRLTRDDPRTSNDDPVVADSLWIWVRPPIYFLVGHLFESTSNGSTAFERLKIFIL